MTLSGRPSVQVMEMDGTIGFFLWRQKLAWAAAAGAAAAVVRSSIVASVRAKQHSGWVGAFPKD